jgi:hypothetical protein
MDCAGRVLRPIDAHPQNSLHQEHLALPLEPGSCWDRDSAEEGLDLRNSMEGGVWLPDLQRPLTSSESA